MQWLLAHLTFLIPYVGKERDVPSEIPETDAEEVAPPPLKKRKMSAKEKQGNIQSTDASTNAVAGPSKTKKKTTPSSAAGKPPQEDEENLSEEWNEFCSPPSSEHNTGFKQLKGVYDVPSSDEVEDSTAVDSSYMSGKESTGRKKRVKIATEPCTSAGGEGSGKSGIKSTNTASKTVRPSTNSDVRTTLQKKKLVARMLWMNRHSNAFLLIISGKHVTRTLILKSVQRSLKTDVKKDCHW